MADVALTGDDGGLRPTLTRVREVNARSADTVAALLQLANVDVRVLDNFGLATPLAARQPSRS